MKNTISIITGGLAIINLLFLFIVNNDKDFIAALIMSVLFTFMFLVTAKYTKSV